MRFRKYLRSAVLLTLLAAGFAYAAAPVVKNNSIVNFTNGIFSNTAGTLRINVLGTDNASRYVTLDGSAATANRTISLPDGNVTLTTGTSAVLSGAAFTGRVTTTDGVSSGTARVVGGRAYQLTAAGTALTNSTSETVLCSYSFPASSFVSGTTSHLSWGARVTADNGATTLTGRVRFGATTLAGTALVTTAAVDTSSGHWFAGEFDIQSRAAAGAAVGMTGWGLSMLGATGASGAAPVLQVLTPANFATNAAILVEVTGQWSAADANSVQCEYMSVDVR